MDDQYKSPVLAKHFKKIGITEDAHNAAWKLSITFGKAMAYDKSRCAGWYPSPCTIGPEPKPMQTGTTIHSMCVTKGPLATYTVYVRVYGGKTDENTKK